MTDEEVRHKAPHLAPPEVRQHLRAARTEFRHSLEAMLPPEFVEHRRAARREMLLAARSLIEHALEQMEKSQKP